MRTRPLVIVIVVLLVVILIESCIYLFYSNTSSNTTKPTSLSDIRNRIKTQSKQVPNAVGDNALDSAELDSLLSSSKNIKADVLKSYRISVVLEGVISELTWPDTKTLESGPSIPRLLFAIQGVNGDIHQFGITQNSDRQVADVTVIGSDGKKESLESLKIGDKVEVSVVMDLTDSKLGKTINIWTITKKR